MPLALRSKSIRKRINNNEGVPYYCDACRNYTHWYVCILATINPPTHHTICIDCYERDTWQERIALKETITKEASLNGYKKLASKRKGNRSLELWEESIAEISSGTSKDNDW